MKTIDLATSSIPSQMSLNMMDHYQMTWPPQRTPDFYRVMFMTFANILKFYKNKEKKAGFILKDMNGNFKFGAIITYHAPEDGEENSDDDKGNFTLEFTLKPEDMDGIETIVDNHTDIFQTCSTRQAAEIMYGRFCQPEYCNQLFIEGIDTLMKFLDTNADEAEEVELIYKGIFTATVAVEGGEKVIDIVPGELVKQFIKSDSSL